MPLLGSLWVPQQEIEEGLVESRAGTAFTEIFPKPIPERPYLGQNYRINSVSLLLSTTIRLKQPQPETFPQMLDRTLLLMRGIPPVGELVGSWAVSFQMRLVPGSGELEWTGQTQVYQNLDNPIDYVLGETLFFAITGIIPGYLGAPPVKPGPSVYETETLANQEEQIAEQAESNALLEAVLKAIQEHE